ncbi:MAG: hypothetical protein V7L23_22650 [Nostoc sp.]
MSTTLAAANFTTRFPNRLTELRFWMAMRSLTKIFATMSDRGVPL